jgi:hypothetical protein
MEIMNSERNSELLCGIKRMRGAFIWCIAYAMKLRIEYENRVREQSVYENRVFFEVLFTRSCV